MTDAEKAFMVLCSAEICSYMTMYAPEKVVVSTREIADCKGWTCYRTKKAIKTLVEMGLIERSCVGCPAVESRGEYRELVFEAMPPKNGYSITKQGFQSEWWKKAHNEWCKSLEEWANKPFEEEQKNADCE